MTLSDVVNFIGSISTISMSAAVKQRGFLLAVSTGQLRVKEWQCWIPNEWLTKGRPVIRHPGAIPVRPLCFQRFWGAKIAEGGMMLGGSSRAFQKMEKNAWFRMHACLGAHESRHERMKKAMKQNQRRTHTRKEKEEKKTERRKEGKNQRKK